MGHDDDQVCVNTHYTIRHGILLTSVIFIRFSTNDYQMDVMMSMDYNMMDNIRLI
jgi:hypothetical protein